MAVAVAAATTAKAESSDMEMDDDDEDDEAGITTRPAPARGTTDVAAALDYAAPGGFPTVLPARARRPPGAAAAGVGVAAYDRMFLPAEDLEALVLGGPTSENHKALRLRQDAALRGGGGGVEAMMAGDDVLDARAALASRELGLVGADGAVEDDDDGLFAPDELVLVQLPPLLPRKVGGGGGGSSSSAAAPPAAASLGDLPHGLYLGKLRVYASGRVKLVSEGGPGGAVAVEGGEAAADDKQQQQQQERVLLDVAGGVPVRSRHDVALLDPRRGMARLLGSVARRAIVTPDVWQLMTAAGGGGGGVEAVEAAEAARGRVRQPAAPALAPPPAPAAAAKRAPPPPQSSRRPSQPGRRASTAAATAAAAAAAAEAEAAEAAAAAVQDGEEDEEEAALRRAAAEGAADGGLVYDGIGGAMDEDDGLGDDD